MLAQATEVIKILLGKGNVLSGRLLVYDALAMTFKVREGSVLPQRPFLFLLLRAFHASFIFTRLFLFHFRFEGLGSLAKRRHDARSEQWLRVKLAPLKFDCVFNLSRRYNCHM